MDLSKQPGAQPRGSEAPLHDNHDALVAYVDRLYAAFGVDDAAATSRRVRKAPPLPKFLQGGGGRR